MTFLEMLEQPFGAICQDEKGMQWRVARNRKGDKQVLRVSKVRGGLKASEQRRALLKDDREFVRAFTPNKHGELA